MKDEKHNSVQWTETVIVNVSNSTK